MTAYTPAYPLTLPAVTGIQTQNFQLNRTIAVSVSPFTAQQQVFEHEGEFWSGVFSLPPMTKTTAAVWIAFLLKLRGQRGTFKIGDQDRKTIQGSETNTIYINGAGQTGNSVAIDGFTISTAGVLKAGDYIQINSYLYMVTEDVTSNGAGEADVKIEPALRSSIETINDDTTVVYTNTTTVMRLDANTQEWDTNQASRYGISFSCVESLV